MEGLGSRPIKDEDRKTEWISKGGRMDQGIVSRPIEEDGETMSRCEEDREKMDKGIMSKLVKEDEWRDSEEEERDGIMGWRNNKQAM